MAKVRATAPFSHASAKGQVDGQVGDVFDSDDFGDGLGPLIASGLLVPVGVGEQQEASTDGEPFDGASAMNASEYVTAAIAAAEEAGSEDGRRAMLQAALDFEQSRKGRSTVVGPLKEELGDA